MINKDKLYQVIQQHLSPKMDNRSSIHDLVSAILRLDEQSDLGSLEERKQAFIEEVRPYLSAYSKEMLNDFTKFWIECKTGKNAKMRWEKEKTWDTNLRLQRWQKMSKKFSIVNLLNKATK